MGNSWKNHSHRSRSLPDAWTQNRDFRFTSYLVRSSFLKGLPPYLLMVYGVSTSVKMIERSLLDTVHMN